MASEPTRKEVYAFLEDLRRSGQTNMWGSPDFLRHEFGMSQEEANEWFRKWKAHKEAGA